MPRLAHRIAGDGVVDAAVIGAAAASLQRKPDSWRDWGSYWDTYEHLKQLWHVVVHHGYQRFNVQHPTENGRSPDTSLMMLAAMPDNETASAPNNAEGGF
jgi:hypothetical protein